MALAKTSATDAPTAPTRSPLTRRSISERLPPAVWVGLLCLLVVMLADAVIRHESGITGDEPFYERMATHPGGVHTFPYAFRVAVPWLVHVLPFSHVISFTLLAWIAIAASGAVLYELLSEFEISPHLSLALVLGFALSPPLLVVLVRHGRSVDPASILVLMLGTLFIVRRRLIALTITTLIGVGVRESSLFLIPFAYAVWARSLFDRDALRDTAAIALAPVAAYVVLRTTIRSAGRQYIPGYTGPFLRNRIHIIRTALSGHTLIVELRRLAYAYGPLWLVAPFALKDLRFARRGLVLVALCAASMTFAYDWGRIIFLAAPVFYVAGGWVIRDRRRLALAIVLVLFALDLGYGIYLQAYGVAHGIDTTVSHRVPIY